MTLTKGCGVAALLAAAFALSPSADGLPSMTDSGRAALHELLRSAVANSLAPAVAVVVVNRGQVLFSDAAGRRDVANDAAASPDSIFRIASMTKPVTSLAAMMLTEEGTIGLDDPVAKYLPEFGHVRVMTAFNEADGTLESRPPARPITVRHLLTHTSGISYSFMDPRLAKMDDGKKTEADLPLLHDPGERFTYGPNTAVLGSVVAKVSGLTLAEFFRTRIFEPLGMTDTSFAVPPEKRDRVVTQQTRAGGRFTEQPNPATLQSRGRGDDGLFSTAGDYGRFMQLFLNGGTAGSRRLVRESTVRAMTSNQIGAIRLGQHPAVVGAIAKPFPFRGELDAFGLGFQIQMPPQRAADRGLRSLGSYGWVGIFNTYFWIDPEKQIGAAVLMQYLPAYDDGAVTILQGVERLVYQHMRVRS